ncbi:MAG: hypothetical protein WA303_05525 [Bradyrhizobium sp.]|jgi:hypothetical protein
MRRVDRRRLEDWLARCRWLETTRLDDHTRSRLERLIIDLEQDLNEDEFERLSQRLTG